MAIEAGTSGKDRRRHTRFVCEGSAEVMVFQPKFLFRGRIRDLSESGCFIETSVRLNLKRMAEVEVRFTERGVYLAVLARVMVIRPGRGAGFEFLSSDPRLSRAFHQLVEVLDVAGPDA
jgi:hypothetical protein